METLEATTTRSIYFNAPKGADYFGHRFEAGTPVLVSENRRGQLVARVRCNDGWKWFVKAGVSMDDLDPNC